MKISRERAGRKAEPSGALLDSLNVKVTGVAKERGIDGGKSEGQEAAHPQPLVNTGSKLRHHRTIPHTRLGGQFAPQMRCKTLQYTKYSCGFAPFCGTNFRANPHALNDAVIP